VYVEACEQLEQLTGYQDICEGLPAPIIILMKMEPKMYGYYRPGKPYVYINIDMDNQYGTAVHEMVHYILYAKIPETSRCAGERLARIAKANYSGEKYNPAWRDWYNCLPD